MKTILLLITCLFSLQICSAQSNLKSTKNLIGLIGTFHLNKNLTAIGVGVRYMRKLSNPFTLGIEANYKQFLGTYGNSDKLNGIIFSRLNIINGFYAEAGAQVSQIVSSARSTEYTCLKPNIYGAIGFKQKIYKSYHLDLQIRADESLIHSRLLVPRFYLGMSYQY